VEKGGGKSTSENKREVFWGGAAPPGEPGAAIRGERRGKGEGRQRKGANSTTTGDGFEGGGKTRLRSKPPHSEKGKPAISRRRGIGEGPVLQGQERWRGRRVGRFKRKKKEQF